MDLIDLFRHETGFQVIPAGQPIFLAGEVGRVMFVLMEGHADILVGDEVVESAWPGAIFGEMALIDSAPRSASVIARTECHLLTIDAETFDDLVQKSPEFARHVMKVMAVRIRSMNDGNALLIKHLLEFSK
jgi:CRP/FNR family transcriptional regulator, cyclic AMP receptor protein